VLALLPVGLGYLCGYMAKHSPREVDPASAAELVAGPDLGVVAAALNEVRAIINRPVTVTLDGKTVATLAQRSPTQDGIAPSGSEGRLTDAAANPDSGN
jgi:hypothetical protein